MATSSPPEVVAAVGVAPCATTVVATGVFASYRV
jgi:hypothetical protein